MISTKWMGRLGNQMFQYAALYSAHRATGHAMATEPWDGDSYFTLPKLPRPRPTRIYHEHPSQAFDPVVLQIPDGTELRGFFQTEKYFAKLRREILWLFTLRKDFQEKLDKEVQSHDRPILAVHAREGDFTTSNGVFPVASQSYLRNALELVDRRSGPLGKYSVVLLSDNPRSRALDFLPQFRRSRLPPVLDMFLMTRAAALVLSASSFSFWGAWLNQGSPFVVGPRYWINSQRPAMGWLPASIEVPSWNYIDEDKHPIPPTSTIKTAPPPPPPPPRLAPPQGMAFRHQSFYASSVWRSRR